ncbi:hypothetical protein [Polyangium aurulentum]|uniref:hypothetical protein n=1 Tax=Polyangium aurulentum TaxID=2567896 RepID=UPI0010AE6FF9|nr:hypothetical protein [Polyangium aurulentum]UQA59728.1 hypothetical protein E8A73_004270 [Polyangium aurulentum]
MNNFYVLNLPDLKLGLDDLFTKRHAALLTSKVGKGHEDILAFQRKAIDALPPALTGGKPFAEELSGVDSEHDGSGAGIWHLTEAYLRAPKVDPKVVEAARRIRAAFIPELGQLQDSYADEAEAAARRKGELSNLEADLKLIPVAGGGTLYDWAVMYLSAGEKLSVLLSQRADIDAKKRKNAQALRSETVGILNELRAGIGREVERNPELPRDLDGQIFGYFDTLEAQREAQNRAAKAAKGKAGGTKGE